MTYLAVDKNGNEAVFKRKPKRMKRTNKWDDEVRKFVCVGRLYPDGNGYEYNETQGSMQNIKKKTKSILPKGSIEKLIGKKLTWTDDPYKMGSNKL